MKLHYHYLADLSSTVRGVFREFLSRLSGSEIEAKIFYRPQAINDLLHEAGPKET